MCQIMQQRKTKMPLSQSLCSLRFASIPRLWKMHQSESFCWSRSDEMMIPWCSLTTEGFVVFWLLQINNMFPLRTTQNLVQSWRKQVNVKNPALISSRLNTAGQLGMKPFPQLKWIKGYQSRRQSLPFVWEFGDGPSLHDISSLSLNPLTNL